MKKIACISLSFLLVAMTSFAQPVNNVLPTSTAMIHYRLVVGYNSTTVLIFPSPVIQADRGYKDLIAQKQPGVENVLKLKAARKDFPPTNLHIFTANGKIYAFDISYAADPAQTTFDLTKLDTSTQANAGTRPAIELSQIIVDQDQLATGMHQMKQAKPFFSASSRKYQMKITLQAIYQKDNMLVFCLSLTNRSTLPYDIDFSRLSIRDKHQAKRSSAQEREIIPVQKDTLTTIPGQNAVTWAVAVPTFTIPDHRKMVIELYEKNGGRQLTLEIKNHQLFKARKW
jgi:conjugative transposon TraN protein